MSVLKLSDFLKIDPKPFICGAFLSRIMEEDIDGKKYFYAYSDYRKSKFVYEDDFDFVSYVYEYKEQLNSVSGYHNWEVEKATNGAARLKFKVLCDIDNFGTNELYNYLFKMSTTSDWALEENENPSKAQFIRGFVELRGSVDTTARFIAQDYFYNSKKELKKSKILTDTMNIDIDYANFNARELQPQYVENISKRNSQFRINLFYYANKIGFINKYKALIFENAYKCHVKKEVNEIIYFEVKVPAPKKVDATFASYLNFYTNNIYNREINEALLADLRKQLGFTNKHIDKVSRNKIIISTFDRISPDVCACCGATKTYTKQNGKQYFEIHHVVSFANGSELDNIANLVKLCPTCHRMMKKGSGSVDDQINANKKFLEEHEEIYEFASATLNEEDIDKLAILIQQKLK